ncbi:MAG TPA: hypothetical protein VFV38_50920 [Ktedonobacteraceae bacterium]|nr:hypothetical protein [Ktedonobacteraceae bacterium]
MVDSPGVTVPGVVGRRLLAVGLGETKSGLPPGLSRSPDQVAAWSSSGSNAGCCGSNAFQICLTVGLG